MGDSWHIPVDQWECAKLHGLRGLEKLPGSWVVGRGTRVNLRGSWVNFPGAFLEIILRE